MPKYCPIINSIPGGRQAWVVEGRKWQAVCLKYMFLNSTNDLGIDAQRRAVKDAFALWERKTGLLFLEVTNEQDADIGISWGTFDQGAPCFFVAAFG